MERLSKFTTEELKQRIEHWLQQIAQDKPDSFACHLDCALVECNGPKMEATYLFQTRKEMENPWGVTHGGMLALLLDYAMGTTARTMLDQNTTPTVSMQINYMKPVPIDVPLYVRVRINSAGRSLAHLSAEAWSENENHFLTAATGVYFLRNVPLELK